MDCVYVGLEKGGEGEGGGGEGKARQDKTRGLEKSRAQWGIGAERMRLAGWLGAAQSLAGHVNILGCLQALYGRPVPPWLPLTRQPALGGMSYQVLSSRCECLIAPQRQMHVCARHQGYVQMQESAQAVRSLAGICQRGWHIGQAGGDHA